MLHFLRKMRPVDWASVAIAAIGAFFLSRDGMSLIGNYVLDDAYITFTFSHNLAEGNGPVYAGGMKAEGYSNFLWMVLVAGGELLGTDPLVTARNLSSVFLALSWAGAWLIARRFSGPGAACLAVLWLATSQDYYRALSSGLETLGFCGCIAMGLAHFTVEKWEGQKERKWSILWFSGAALMRIDGFIPLGLIVGLEGLHWISHRDVSLKKLGIWAAVGCAPVAVYWIWRYSYYGLPFPLTYYAKASLAIEMDQRGMDYAWNFLRDTGLWTAVLLAAWNTAQLSSGLLPSERDQDSHAPGAVNIAAFIAALTGYVVHVGGDWMPFNRMMLPVQAPLVALAVSGLSLPKRRTQAVWVPLVATAAVTLSAVGYSAQHMSQRWINSPLEKKKIEEAAWHVRHGKDLANAAQFFRAIVQSPDDVLVTDYGGFLAYGLDATVIERWGLANKDIALKGDTKGIMATYGKTCIPCYPEFDPDYFHPGKPLVRTPDAFRSKAEMIRRTFQGPELDRVLNLRKNYRVGRATRVNTTETAWFFEKIRPGRSFAPRTVGEFRIDYPPM